MIEFCLKNSIDPYVNEIHSDFISACCKHYGTGHVIMKLVEEWRKNLDQSKFVGSLLMDLSKAFDCVPHDLLFLNSKPMHLI